MGAEDDEFQRLVDEGLIPRLEASAMGMLMHPDKKIEAQFAVQLGAMVLLDKPIMVVVDPDYEVPAKLRAIADEIVVWKLGDDRTEFEAALMRMAQRFGSPEMQENLEHSSLSQPL